MPCGAGGAQVAHDLAQGHHLDPTRMKILFALGMQLMVLLTAAWPIVWAVHLVQLATRRLWSRFALCGLLILPYLAALGACVALFLGGHNGPTDSTVHRVFGAAGATVLVLWLLLGVSMSRKRSTPKAG